MQNRVQANRFLVDGSETGKPGWPRGYTDAPDSQASQDSQGSSNKIAKARLMRVIRPGSAMHSISLGGTEARTRQNVLSLNSNQSTLVRHANAAPLCCSGVSERNTFALRSHFTREHLQQRSRTQRHRKFLQSAPLFICGSVGDKRL
jgi:hypothetical protein